MEAVEEEIYDCIRVLYPNQINLPNFVNLEDEVVEDPVDDLEAQIIDSYQPVPEEEPEPETEPPPPPRNSHTGIRNPNSIQAASQDNEFNAIKHLHPQ